MKPPCICLALLLDCTRVPDWSSVRNRSALSIHKKMAIICIITKACRVADWVASIIFQRNDNDGRSYGWTKKQKKGLVSYLTQDGDRIHNSSLLIFKNNNHFKKLWVLKDAYPLHFTKRDIFLNNHGNRKRNIMSSGDLYLTVSF